MSAAAAATSAAASSGAPAAIASEVAAAAAAKDTTTPASATPTGPAATASSATPAADGAVTPAAGTAAAKGAEPAAPYLGDVEPKPVEKKDGEKPAAAAKPDEAPAKLELKLPDEVKEYADPKLLEEYTALATELGLNSEQATKQAAWHLAKAKAADEALRESWDKRPAQWKEELAKDAEFGGAHLKESEEAVARAWRRWSTPEDRKAVQELGLENWPPLVKLFRRLGLATKEDSSAVPAGGSTTPKPAGELKFTYPSMDPSTGKPVPGYKA